MKASFNQNNIGLYPVDDEFVHDCENCIFLRAVASDFSYRCRLVYFGKEFYKRLPSCFESIFISEPLSDVFKL